MTPDRFRCCLLGLAVGDAVGAPYEGLTGDNLFWGHGSPPDLIAAAGAEPLYYTDDTEMTFGVAQVLADHGHIDEPALVAAFAANYHPERGYGRGARNVIEAMRDGGDWRTLAATQFPGGSLGNGAAMRVAPVGLLFFDDFDRLWAEARLSALPTHVHPVGIEGAQLLALAVALALRPGPLDRRAFYAELRARAVTEEFRWALNVAAKLRPGQSVAGLGNSLEAHRSVVTSIACFVASPTNYESTLARAMALGDDIDTLMAMAGALAGAHGAEVPPRLVAVLEDGPLGRSALQVLAERLWARRGHAP